MIKIRRVIASLLLVLMCISFNLSIVDAVGVENFLEDKYLHNQENKDEENKNEENKNEENKNEENKDEDSYIIDETIEEKELLEGELNFEEYISKVDDESFKGELDFDYRSVTNFYELRSALEDKVKNIEIMNDFRVYDMIKIDYYVNIFSNNTERPIISGSSSLYRDMIIYVNIPEETVDYGGEVVIRGINISKSSTFQFMKIDGNGDQYNVNIIDCEFSAELRYPNFIINNISKVVISGCKFNITSFFNNSDKLYVGIINISNVDNIDINKCEFNLDDFNTFINHVENDKSYNFNMNLSNCIINVKNMDDFFNNERSYRENIFKYITMFNNIKYLEIQDSEFYFDNLENIKDIEFFRNVEELLLRNIKIGINNLEYNLNLSFDKKITLDGLELVINNSNKTEKQEYLLKFTEDVEAEKIEDINVTIDGINNYENIIVNEGEINQMVSMQYNHLNGDEKCKFIYNKDNARIKYLSKPILNNVESKEIWLIYNEGIIDKISDIEFQNNKLEKGAAIYSNNKIGSIEDGLFSNNKLEESTVIFNEGEIDFIVKLIFKDNETVSGGIIYNNEGSINNINEVLFQNNKAEHGGAIYNQGKLNTMSDISFIENKAKQGGAIYNTGVIESLNSKNICFNNNQAEEGGAIYIEDIDNMANNQLIISKDSNVSDDKWLYLDKSVEFEDNEANEFSPAIREEFSKYHGVTDNRYFIEEGITNSFKSEYKTPLNNYDVYFKSKLKDIEEKPVEPSNPGGGNTVETERPSSTIEKPYIPSKKPEKIEVSIKDEKKLNRLDHFQYINGYEDNTIRPEDNITREEVAAVFFRLLDNDYKEKVRKNTNNFTDLSTDRWSNKHISTLNNAKVLTGYEDNTFRPGENITRAEVAAIASRFDDLEVGENMFKDIKGHWAEKYISSASMKGWIKGYEDGTFRPDEYITRAEFVSLVNGLLNRKVDKKGLSEIDVNTLNSYKDLNENKWYYFDIIEASNSHLYKERTLGKISEVWIELKEINVEM